MPAIHFASLIKYRHDEAFQTFFTNQGNLWAAPLDFLSFLTEQPTSQGVTLWLFHKLWITEKNDIMFFHRLRFFYMSDIRKIGISPVELEDFGV